MGRGIFNRPWNLDVFRADRFYADGSARQKLSREMLSWLELSRSQSEKKLKNRESGPRHHYQPPKLDKARNPGRSQEVGGGPPVERDLATHSDGSSSVVARALIAGVDTSTDEQGSIQSNVSVLEKCGQLAGHDRLSRGHGDACRYTLDGQLLV